MHIKGIVHRDIKSDNILVASVDNLEIKLTDFGLSIYLDKSLDNDILGTPLYMAPELIKSQKYDSKIDIWSAGIVSYILLSGKLPFTGKNKE